VASAIAGADSDQPWPPSGKGEPPRVSLIVVVFYCCSVEVSEEEKYTEEEENDSI
jgi:hypothetical protein